MATPWLPAPQNIHSNRQPNILKMVQHSDRPAVGPYLAVFPVRVKANTHLTLTIHAHHAIFQSRPFHLQRKRSSPRLVTSGRLCQDHGDGGGHAGASPVETRLAASQQCRG